MRTDMVSQIAAIDLHSHLNHGAPDDVPTSPVRRADLDFLHRMSQSTNICCGVYSTYASVLSAEYICRENKFLRDLSARKDWVYQWVVVDPRQEETMAQAEELLNTNKCLGIKIHPKIHGYELPEYAHRLFGFANERNAVVLTHPTAEEQFDAVVDAADAYPNMRLIIAHLGSVAHVEAIRRAKHRNIYTDTSGRAMTLNYVLEYAVEQVGSERIFFGTDTYACAFQRGRIEYAMITDRDKENILRTNALREFDKLSRVFA